MLGIEELLELEDSLRIELNDNLTGILTNLNRTDQLEMFYLWSGWNIFWRKMTAIRSTNQEK